MYIRHVTIKVHFYFQLRFTCRLCSCSGTASNSSQPTRKWTTFPDIFSPSLQFPDEKFNVLITKHAAAVGKEIQVGMKHVHL